LQRTAPRRRRSRIGLRHGFVRASTRCAETCVSMAAIIGRARSRPLQGLTMETLAIRVPPE
jgi:hypothetical protein